MSDLENCASKDELSVHQTDTLPSQTVSSHKFSPSEQSSIIRRVDVRLVLTLGAMYCVSLMDRTNLGFASIAGMTSDLKLNVGSRYTLVTLIFFIPYILFQPPATIALRKIGPRLFLSAITLFWGAVMIGAGFVKDWTALFGLRFTLGLLEAGFFPGCAYLLSTWYPRYDLQKRNAAFYLIGTAMTAVSGILAYGLTQMEGVGGLEGWRWIFIIEGVITCLLAIIGFFLIVDFPEKASNSLHFLTKVEAAFIVTRIEDDRQDTWTEKFNVTSYFKNALDLKVWAFAALYGLTNTTTYAIAYFLPIILYSEMGFSLAKAQCLVAPPYAAAAIVMYGQAHLADRWRTRGPIIIFNSILALIGLPLIGFSTKSGVQFFGVFLVTIGASSQVPAVLTYQANNIRGQWKRAFCSATLVGFGGIGGIIASTVFRQVDAPKYVPGIIATMTANGLIILVVSGLTFKFWRANKRASGGGKPIEGLQGFLYTY